jgi:Protein of unknown function (DUF2946)
LLKSRRIRLLCLAAFVLPVLLLRAAIPAGFMAASVDGTWQIVLCEPQMMMAAGHHHHHHHSDSHDSMPSDVDPTCPYAQSAGPALMPTLPLLPTVAMMHRLQPQPATTQTRLPSGPARQQFPRGPPSLV